MQSNIEWFSHYIFFDSHRIFLTPFLKAIMTRPYMPVSIASGLPSAVERKYLSSGCGAVMAYRSGSGDLETIAKAALMTCPMIFEVRQVVSDCIHMLVTLSLDKYFKMYVEHIYVEHISRKIRFAMCLVYHRFYILCLILSDDWMYMMCVFTLHRQISETSGSTS